MKKMMVQIKFVDGSYTQMEISSLQEIEDKYGFQNILIVAVI